MEQVSPFSNPTGVQNQAEASRQQRQSMRILIDKAERAYLKGQQVSIEELQILDQMSQQIRGHGFAKQKSGGGIGEFAKGALDSVLLGVPTAFGMDGPDTIAAASSRGAGEITGTVASLAAGGFGLGKGLLTGTTKAAQAAIAARNAAPVASRAGSIMRGVKNTVDASRKSIAIGAGYGAVSGAAGAARDETGQFTSAGDVLVGGATGGLLGASLGLAAGAAGYGVSKMRAPAPITDEARLLPQTGTKGTVRPMAHVADSAMPTKAYAPTVDPSKRLVPASRPTGATAATPTTPAPAPTPTAPVAPVQSADTESLVSLKKMQEFLGKTPETQRMKVRQEWMSEATSGGTKMPSRAARDRDAALVKLFKSLEDDSIPADTKKQIIEEISSAKLGDRIKIINNYRRKAALGQLKPVKTRVAPSDRRSDVDPNDIDLEDLDIRDQMSDPGFMGSTFGDDDMITVNI